MKMHESKQFVLAALALAMASAGAGASTIYGSLDNFDVVNDTGSETHGFEIELEGVSSSDIYRTFDAPYIRYGTPTLVDYNNGTTHGVYVRYQSAWDATTHTFLQATPVAAPGYVPAYDSCWTIGLGAAYAGSGCEHFGVSMTTQPTNVKYHWLVGDPLTGSFSVLGSLVPLPTPVWSVLPAMPGAQPVVQAEIEIPIEEGESYGEAYWVKIYKTEVDHAIDLDNLLLDDPLMAGAEVEIEWELLQAKPGLALALNEDPLGDGMHAVLRRYEFYRYNTPWGAANTYVDNEGFVVPYVDPATGEVTACVVDGCNAPTEDELARSSVARWPASILRLCPCPPRCGCSARVWRA